MSTLTPVNHVEEIEKSMVNDHFAHQAVMGASLQTKAVSRAKWIITFAVFLFLLATISHSLFRHWHMWSDIDSLGYTIQTHWNTWHGRPWESSIEVQNNLGDHTTFVDVLTFALYLIYPSTNLIVSFEPIVFALGVIFVWRIARYYELHPNAALLLSLAYLAQPAAWFAVIHEYHQLAYTPLLGLWTFDLAIRGRLRWAWVAAIALLLVREETGLALAGIGIIIALVTKYRKTGLAMTAVGMVTAAFMIAVLIPILRGGASADTIGDRYGHFGSSASEVLITLITRPDLVIALLFEDVRRLLFIPILILPFLFLPVLCRACWAGLLLTTLPGILSSSYCQYTIGWHYPYLALPIVAIGAILGMDKLLRWQPGLLKPRVAITAVIIWLMLLAGLHIDGPTIRWRWMFGENPLVAEVEQIKHLIPDDAALAATGKVGAQFAGRRQIGIWRDKFQGWPEKRFPKLQHREPTHILINLYNHNGGGERVPDLTRYELIAQTKSLRLYQQREIALPDSNDALASH